MAKQYLNPYSRRVQARVVRSNPLGFSTVEIKALSSHPGFRADSKIADLRTYQDQRMLRAQLHAREVYRRASRYNDTTDRIPFPYQDVGAAFFIEKAGQATRPVGERLQSATGDVLTDDAMALHVSPSNSVRMAILDPMGLGKTIQGALTILSADALNVLHRDKFPTPYPVLVVCPRALRDAWAQEMTTLGNFGPSEVLINKGNLDMPVWQSFLAKKGKVLITTPQSLMDGDVDPAMVVVDEADWIRNPETAQSAVFRGIADHASYMVLLTGTPAINAVGDIFPMLRFLQHQPTITSTRGINSAVRAWASGEGIDPNEDLFDNMGRKDTVDSNDAVHLEHLIRDVAVRRSRQRVFDSNTLREDQLQQKKHRRAIPIDENTHRLIPSIPVTVMRDGIPYTTTLDQKAKDAWDRYLAASKNAAALIGARSANTDGLNIAQALDRIVDYLQGRGGMESILGLIPALKLQPLTPDIADPDAAVNDVLSDNGRPAHMAYVAALSATRRTYIGIPSASEDLPGLMAEVATTHAPWHQSLNQGKDLVYFLPRLEVEGDRTLLGSGQKVNIINELAQALSLSAPEREVYVLSGNQKLNNKWRQGNVVELEMTTRAIELNFNKKDFTRPPKTIIVTAAGKMGLNLRSADVVAMLGRSTSPAIEDQIEDRINRADRLTRGQPPIPEPVAEYLIPQDVFSYVLSHRLENRRRNLMRMFNEDVGEANRSVGGVRWGTDRSHPIFIGKLIDAYAQRASEEPNPVTRGVIQNLLMAAEFISDPIMFVRREINSIWSTSINGHLRASIDNAAAPRPMIDKLYSSPYRTFAIPLENLRQALTGTLPNTPWATVIRGIVQASERFSTGYVVLTWDKYVILPDGTLIKDVQFERAQVPCSELLNWHGMGGTITKRELGKLDSDQYVVLAKHAANMLYNPRSLPVISRGRTLVPARSLWHIYRLDTSNCIYRKPAPPAPVRVDIPVATTIPVRVEAPVVPPSAENVVLDDDQVENAGSGFIEFKLGPLGVGKAFQKDHRPGELLFIARSHGRSGDKDFSVIADVDILEPIRGGHRVVLKDYYRVVDDDYYSDKDRVYARAKSSGVSLKQRFERSASSNPRKLRRKRR